jgi:predicted nucleotidyltransferase
METPNLGWIEPYMGTMKKSSPPEIAPATGRVSLADALFSGTQQQVLGLLFGQPDRSFYANEVIALVNRGSGVVQRELAKLANSELVTVRLFGKQKHYQANPGSPIHAELCGIVQKTMGLAEPLRKALAPLAHRIHAAFVYGSIAKREDTASSDIDLMIESDDVTYADIFTTLEDLSSTFGRMVNPTLYTPEEWAQRIERGDSFVKRVRQQPKVWLIGDEHAFAV